MYHQKMLIDGRHVCCDLIGAAMGRSQEEPARRTPGLPPRAALRSRYVSYALQYKYVVDRCVRRQSGPFLWGK